MAAGGYFSRLASRPVLAATALRPVGRVAEVAPAELAAPSVAAPVAASVRESVATPALPRAEVVASASLPLPPPPTERAIEAVPRAASVTSVQPATSATSAVTASVPLVAPSPPPAPAPPPPRSDVPAAIAPPLAAARVAAPDLAAALTTAFSWVASPATPAPARDDRPAPAPLDAIVLLAPAATPATPATPAAASLAAPAAVDGPTLHIGSIEVEVVAASPPPPAPRQVASPSSAGSSAPRQPLARGFVSGVGLRQS